MKAKPLPTKEELEKILYYDETSESGLRWKNDRFSGRKYSKVQITKGSVAGTLKSNNVWLVHLNKKLYLSHRLIMVLHGYTLGSDDVVDHIDGNKSNNSILNLRVVSQGINSRNRKLQYNNKTGVSGISKVTKNWSPDPSVEVWRVQWQVDGKKFAKYFSSIKLGDKAFETALAYRLSIIEKLNENGYGYTERHFKPINNMEEV